MPCGMWNGSIGCSPPFDLQLGLFSIFIVDCSAVIIIIPPTSAALAAVLALITFLFWLCIIALLLPKSSLEFLFAQ